MATSVTQAAALETGQRILDNVASVVHGDPQTLRLCVAALLSESHVLLEDVPGVGKTVLAKALARSVDCDFARLQFTPDLLPSDVTGVSVFDQRIADFSFRPGPVFANVLLIDEINRASPKTQAALLECMQEAQVTIDGETHALPRPFLVVATQNPIEHEGTFPLPEAQLDRFSVLLRLGYPDAAAEARLVAEQTAAGGPPIDALAAVASLSELAEAISEVAVVHVDHELHRYVVALLGATRADPRIRLGASPRAGIALVRLAKAHAFLDGRTFVTPDDIKVLLRPTIAHRLLLSSQARGEAATREEIISSALEATATPL